MELTTEAIARLHQLDDEARALREALHISAPNSVIFQAGLYAIDDDLIVVEADGYGGATVSQVEGNFPVDYMTKHEATFDSEEKATAFANFVLGDDEDGDAEEYGFEKDQFDDPIWPGEE